MAIDHGRGEVFWRLHLSTPNEVPRTSLGISSTFLPAFIERRAGIQSDYRDYAARGRERCKRASLESDVLTMGMAERPIRNGITLSVTLKPLYPRKPVVPRLKRKRLVAHLGEGIDCSLL